MKVFVYGTLKRGHSNNYLLSRAEYIGQGITATAFKMYNVGFPVVFHAHEAAGHRVTGEIFDLGDHVADILPRLDRLEGNGVLYLRTPVQVMPLDLPGVPALDVSMYVGMPAHWWTLPEEYQTQPDGEGFLSWNGCV